VLLPVGVLVRRADTVAVIGAALARAAQGWGHRRVAERLGRSASTVRGWLRRFRMRAGPLREAFTGLLCALDADPLLPAATGSYVADAVAAIVAAAGAVTRRWAGHCVLAVSPWLVAAAVTSGQLLASASTVELTNTSRPW
jgi:transposase-like protein